MENYPEIKQNIEAVRRNIAQAQKSSPYGGEVELLLATKTVDTDRIAYAVKECGVKYIGENRVQELLDKYDALKDLGCELHFIGTLQKNKVKYIIDKVSLIHSVDSVGLAEEINRQVAKHGLTMDVLLEVNIGREPNKSGFMPEEIPDALDEIRAFSSVRVRGLMTLAPICDNSAEYSKYFSKTYRIFIDNTREKMDNIDKPVLSMGMSQSYEAAVACGASMVRVGSAVFGKRPPINQN